MVFTSAHRPIARAKSLERGRRPLRRSQWGKLAAHMILLYGFFPYSLSYSPQVVSEEQSLAEQQHYVR